MKFTAGALLVLGLVVAGHVDADASGLDRAHGKLLRTMESSGVEVVYGVRGEGEGFCRFAFGVYEAFESRVTICFDGKTENWESKSLETLRHEAVHVIQDCRDGMRGDGALQVGMTEEESYEQAEGVIDLDHRLTPYIMGGADEETLVIEAEAFAVSNTVGAGEIADEMAQLCSSLES